MLTQIDGESDIINDIRNQYLGGKISPTLEIRKYIKMEKSIFLVLFLALASWTLVEGSEQFKHSEGLVYAYASSLAYCPPELIMKNE